MVGDRSTIYQNFRIGTFEPSDQGTWLFLMEAKQMYLQLAKLSRCWPLTLLVKLAINCLQLAKLSRCWPLTLLVKLVINCLDVNLRNLSLTCDLKLGLHVQLDKIYNGYT